jgi:hypothetical protein
MKPTPYKLTEAQIAALNGQDGADVEKRRASLRGLLATRAVYPEGGAWWHCTPDGGVAGPFTDPGQAATSSKVAHGITAPG